MTRLVVDFGGRSTYNGHSLKSLRRPDNTYKPVRSDLINRADSVLERFAERNRLDEPFFDHAVNLIQWLENPDAAPTDQLSLTATMSLAHYCLACHFPKRDPRWMRGNLIGTTGHS